MFCKAPPETGSAQYFHSGLDDGMGKQQGQDSGGTLTNWRNGVKNITRHMALGRALCFTCYLKVKGDGKEAPNSFAKK